jgi:hypothetical protein
MPKGSRCGSEGLPMCLRPSPPRCPWVDRLNAYQKKVIYRENAVIVTTLVPLDVGAPQWTTLEPSSRTEVTVRRAVARVTEFSPAPLAGHVRSRCGASRRLEGIHSSPSLCLHLDRSTHGQREGWGADYAAPPLSSQMAVMPPTARPPWRIRACSVRSRRGLWRRRSSDRCPWPWESTSRCTRCQCSWPWAGMSSPWYRGGS